MEIPVSGGETARLPELRGIIVEKRGLSRILGCRSIRAIFFFSQVLEGAKPRTRNVHEKLLVRVDKRHGDAAGEGLDGLGDVLGRHAGLRGRNDNKKLVLSIWNAESRKK